MKRTTKQHQQPRLKLSTSTIRNLQADEMAQAAGGLAGNTGNSWCSNGCTTGAGVNASCQMCM